MNDYSNDGRVKNILLDTTVVVTGAAGGIGDAICTAARNLGAVVVRLDRTQKEPVPGFLHVVCDITNSEALSRAADFVFSESTGEVCLVNCAGICEADTPAEEMDESTWDATMNVNLTGTFKACQAFGSRMLRNGEGAIVNITSMSGTHLVNTPQRQVAYNTSKAALAAMTRTLAVEWGPRGVRVNSVAPGYVLTPMTAQRTSLLEHWTAGSPLQRMATPQDVASAVMFLLDPAASYVLGAELLIDGGYTLV